jgi:hypothetical protein
VNSHHPTVKYSANIPVKFAGYTQAGCELPSGYSQVGCKPPREEGLQQLSFGGWITFDVGNTKTTERGG